MAGFPVLLLTTARARGGFFTVGFVARRFSRRVARRLAALLACFPLLFVRTAGRSARIGHVSLLLIVLKDAIFGSVDIRHPQASFSHYLFNWNSSWWMEESGRFLKKAAQKLLVLWA
ncbi:hypothetical protein [Acidocella sp.]|jgi:hypothetical protein|uniref:hypothetical protein n=1 Tax=Acidocella sp. TaxID=50710 RepID=UPI002F3F47CE